MSESKSSEGPAPSYRLPDELLIEVAKHVQGSYGPVASRRWSKRTDLCNMSLVSKKFHSIAEIELYQLLRIGSPRLRLLQRSLTEQPHLSCYIQAVDLRMWTGWTERGLSIHDPERSQEELVGDILGSAPNLHDLLISAETGQFFLPHFPPLLNLKTFRFESMAWSRHKSVIEHFKSLLHNPLLRKVVVPKDKYAEWVYFSTAELGNDHIQTLVVKRSGALPTDLAGICAAFPSLESLKITSCLYYTKSRYAALWNSRVHTAGIHANAIGTSLALSLPKLQQLVELELNIHMPGENHRAPKNSALIGPLGGLDTLSQLPFLAKLTLGLHMFRCLDVTTHKTNVLSASCLPPALTQLQIFLCFRCCSKVNRYLGPWEATQDTHSLLDDLAHEKHNGSFQRLHKVTISCNLPFWTWDFKRSNIDRAQVGEKDEALQKEVMKDVGKVEEEEKVTKEDDLPFGFYNSTAATLLSDGVQFEAEATSDYYCHSRALW